MPVNKQKSRAEGGTWEDVELLHHSETVTCRQGMRRRQRCVDDPRRLSLFVFFFSFLFFFLYEI